MHSALPAAPFTRAHAEECGISRAGLRSMVAAGQVRRLLRSVYVIDSVPDSVEMRIAALGLELGAEHVACDRTAAWVHGVDLSALGETPARSRPEVCVRRGEVPSARPELRTRTRDLGPGDVMERAGILVTTPLRTALDLGCILRRRDALAAMDRLSALHGLTPGMLREELPRYRGRRGVIQLRSLIPVIDVRAESPAESWTRLAIHDAGVEPPVSQWEVRIGEETYRLDFAYPERLLAVEFDGEEFHSSDEQVKRDNERRLTLMRAGWRFIVVRRDGLTAAGVDPWIRELKLELKRDPIALRW